MKTLQYLLFVALIYRCSATSFVVEPKGKLNILGVFGHPGKSHFDVFYPLLEELARRGHDVTVISHYPRTAASKAAEPLPNYKDISLRNDEVGIFLNVVDLKLIDQSYKRLLSEMANIRRMATISCENGLRNPQVQEFVRSGHKFDVVLTENFNTECFLAIVNKFDAPYLALSSHQIMPWANDRLGNPQETNYMPSIFSNVPRPMNFLHGVANFLTTAFAMASYDIWYHKIDQALAEETYGPGVPDLREIGRNVTAIMINTHFSLHGSRPNLPNVVEVGGLHLAKKSNPLPKDIAKFLDEAKEGVLYFNLGSMVKAASMTEETLNTILRVLGSLPRKVIWKWEVDDLPHRPSNVLIRKWLPQFDILAHPNVKCYFGHGGLLGLSEGIYHGVPMVLMPLFGDQFHNALAAEARAVAVVLRYPELNEQSLRHALDEVFNNTRYRENARKLSKAYRDRPENPLDTAVWWTEYIARGNGLPYLKSEAANVPWYHRHFVDVAFLLAVSLAILYAVCRLVGLLLGLSTPSAGTKANGETRRSKKRD